MLLISTETLPLSGGVAESALPQLVTARSGSPSPLKSPTAAERGLRPSVPKASGDSKVPSPWPSSTESGAAQRALGDGAGGPLSGTAIAGREFGIPAALRTGAAAATLTDGRDILVLAHDHGRVVSACC